MNSGNSKKSIVAPIDLIDLMTFKTNDLYLQLEWNNFKINDIPKMRHTKVKDLLNSTTRRFIKCKRMGENF
jgi:hypothetical protein